MASLRTKEGEEKYAAYKARGGLGKVCALCSKKALMDFKFWRIVPNDFPYDRIASVHHMLIPHRHVEESGFTPEEHREFLELKSQHLNENYGYLIEATHRTKSVPEHFHVHLIVAEEGV